MTIKEKGKSVLTASDLEIGYRGNGRGTSVVTRDINVSLQTGELICLLGPNGSGKSTLIRTLAGMQSPLKGEIRLYGEDLSAMHPKQTAKKLSTVLTDRITIGNLNVYTLVAFGRSPYTGLLGTLRPEDEEAVRWAIRATDMVSFANRDISKLSDGERQKVMIARALAQETSVILLDEPTAHLDLPNRVDIMRLLRRLSHKTGKGILLSTHELDLALKAADRIWLMNKQQELVTGVPEDLVLNGTFEKVFHKESFDFDKETGSFDIHQKKEKAIGLSGDPVPKFWTTRALEREGFEVNEQGEQELQLNARSDGEEFVWRLSSPDGEKEFYSVSDLITELRSRKNEPIEA